MNIRSLISPSDIERETTLPIDVIRKWRSRYGFPQPEKGGGMIGYTGEQVAQLKLIKRLMDGGFRPSQLVGKPLAELQRLSTALSSNVSVSHWSPFTQEAVGLLKSNDVSALQQFLQTELDQKGLGTFARMTVAPLTIALGEAWARNEIEVFHEHICSSLLIQILLTAIYKNPTPPGKPAVLLASPPDELHSLGLLLVQAVLSEAGIRSILLGTNVPAMELPKAAKTCGAAVLGLSFSFAYPQRRVRPLLDDLRNALDPAIELWIGGAGVQFIRNRDLPGIRVFSNLDIPFRELS